MNTTTLDSAGRVVIPKPLRDELGLEAGATLRAELQGDVVTLRPVRGDSRLRKERGVWVFRGEGRLTGEDTDRALTQLREARHRSLRGKG
jgi:AbrB family looped-hinge helix DNA binding protein